MKFTAVILVLFALLNLSLGLKDPICGLPEETGPCKALMPRWSYSLKDNSCKKFIYGGCRGNANRFSSKAECEAKCKE